jgi:hypothetical protein
MTLGPISDGDKMPRSTVKRRIMEPLPWECVAPGSYKSILTSVSDGYRLLGVWKLLVEGLTCIPILLNEIECLGFCDNVVIAESIVVSTTNPDLETGRNMGIST